MKLCELLDQDVENAINAFYDKAYEYVHGGVEDQQKAFYMLVFHKNFKYRNFNQCIEVVENADTNVRPLIPNILWNYCQKHRQKELAKFV